MKKMMLFSAVCASLAAIATTVDSDNTTGVLKVTSDKDYQLISVPWNELGSGDADISVATLVNPDQLAGDTSVRLYVANGSGSYDVFKIVDNAWVGCATATIGTDGLPVEITASPSTTVKRGNAVWLKRTTKSDFYIIGQQTTGTASISLVKGNNLIAPTGTDALDIYDWNGKTGCSKWDTILVPGNSGADILLTYKNNVWNKQTTTDGVTGYTPITEDEFTIPAGTGFWYTAKNAVDNFTL